MKKVEKYIYWVIILILVAVIASGITYILMSDKDDNNKTNENSNQNNNEVVLKDGVELISIKEENDKIIETFKVVLNGKEKELKVEYTYTFDEYDGYQVKGIFNQKDFFVDWYRPSDNSYDFSEPISFNTNDLKEIFNINIIKENFNENNFQTIKGTDNKNYLAITTDEPGMSAYIKQLYILNDNLEIINNNFDSFGAETTDNPTNGMIILGASGWEIKDNIFAGYEDYGICKPLIECNPQLKIENNKIYYLYPVLNDHYEERDYGTLEERIYTINNNVLNYEIINQYKIIGVAGQIK